MDPVKIKIFLFHRISPEKDPLWNPISPEKFETIISYLQHTFTVVQLESYLLDRPKPKHSSKPLAAIVFDDGYKDFIEYALPILKKHNCPCSMYVVTDCVANQLPPWTYILDHHFIQSKKLQLKLNTDLLPENLKKLNFTSVADRMKYAKRFKPFLKTITNSQRTELFDQVISSLDDISVSTNMIMNWSEIIQIRNAGVEIGSHSKTHPLLAKIETKQEIETELKESAKMIEKNLGKFPLTISYPIGSYNNDVKAAAIDCGYKIGLAVDQMPYNSQIHDTFEIPRIELYHESNFKTKLRISGIIQKLNSWRR